MENTNNNLTVIGNGDNNKVEEVKDGIDQMQEGLTAPGGNIEVMKKRVNDFFELRKHIIEKIIPILEEGRDFFVIKNKKSLGKSGAEKLATIWGLTSEFTKDDDTLQMLGEIKGLLCYKCSLYKNGQLCGEGRGADTVTRNQNDPNKAVKMAQKRAYVDAVIRATGLSDIFTQDLEDMDPKTIGDNGNFRQSTPPPQRPQNNLASPAQQNAIVKLLKELDAPADPATCKEWLEKIIQTGPIASFKSLDKNRASEIISKLTIIKNERLHG